MSRMFHDVIKSENSEYMLSNKRDVREVKYPKVIFACAWCKKSTYPPLKKDEEYTHGICLYHKGIFIKQIKLRNLSRAVS